MALLVGLCGACSGAPTESPESPAPEPAPAEPRGGATGKPTPEQRCEALCTRYVACGVRNSEDCMGVCQREAAASHSHHSSPYLWRLILCFDGLPCEPVLAGSAERTCHQVALRQMQPSEALRRFCRESVARADQCRRPADEADCLERFRIMDDASTRAAQGCLEKDCPEIPACFADAFGFASPPER